MGKDGRVDVAVTFDERRGYVGSAPELRSPVVALSLDGLRRKIEALMSPDDVSSTSTRPLAWSAIADGYNKLQNGDLSTNRQGRTTGASRRTRISGWHACSPDGLA